MEPMETTIPHCLTVHGNQIDKLRQAQLSHVKPIEDSKASALQTGVEIESPAGFPHVRYPGPGFWWEDCRCIESAPTMRLGITLPIFPR